MGKHIDQVVFLLDLFESGYKNALVSVMDICTKQGNKYERIEMILPNVGRVCLYQTFIDSLDEQIPKIKIFYSSNTQPKITKQLNNLYLINRGAEILYNAKKYFEMHPEHAIENEEKLIKTIRNNRKFALQSYKNARHFHQGILNILTFGMMK